MAEIAVVALTRRGLEVAKKIKSGYGDRADVYAPYLEGEGEPARPRRGGLTAFLGELFATHEALVLVMAAGIAVRCLAPHLKDKRRDPAVLVVDENGHHVISLLSGHLGGANELARQTARLLGGEAVITTASDLQGLPALDLIARELGLWPVPWRRLPRVAARLVDGGRVAFWAEEPLRAALEGQVGRGRVLPLEEFSGPEGWEAGVLVTDRRLPDYGLNWMFFRPRRVVAGIGCRRGVLASAVLAALSRSLKSAGLSRWSLRALATVDLKADEDGLLDAARRLGCPLLTFSREEIARALAEDPGLEASEKVGARIGVGGVCEPCAKLGTRGGRLIWPKTAYRGVTVALAQAGWP